MSQRAAGCSWISLSMKVSKPPFSAASSSQSTVCEARAATSTPPCHTVWPVASRLTTSSSSISMTSRVSERNAGMADAMNRSPSPMPITSGHSRREATRRSGSFTWATTKAKWPPRRGSTSRTAAARSPRYSRAIRFGTTSVSVSEWKTTPRSCSSPRSSR